MAAVPELGAVVGLDRDAGALRGLAVVWRKTKVVLVKVVS